MKRTTIISGVAMALAVSAGAAAAQDGGNPYWIQPAQDDLASRLFPGFAGMLGESGRATVTCMIEADGHPYLCDVVEEAPQGLGFGSAARVIVASAEVGAARIAGEVVPATVRTTVRFHAPDRAAPFGGWTGPEPSAARLALARDLIGTMRPEARPSSYRERMLDGLDHDRREVVRPWIDELFPRDDKRETESLTLQMARLFDEDELRRIRAGEPVRRPSEEEFNSACPDATSDELAALNELRRRYCDRYECGVEAAGA